MRQAAGRRLLQEQHSSKAFLHIYSALHDPVAGAVRVFADAYPDPQCTDIQSCHVPGEEAWPRMAARAEVPFPRLRAPSEPEPMECIITCQLPPGHEHTNIERLALRDAEGAARATLRVERIETLEKKRGWGICVGPVFSDVPQYEVCMAACMRTALCMGPVFSDLLQCKVCRAACVRTALLPCEPDNHGACSGMQEPQGSCTCRPCMHAHGSCMTAKSGACARTGWRTTSRWAWRASTCTLPI
jgi:hypothetical protein